MVENNGQVNGRRIPLGFLLTVQIVASELTVREQLKSMLKTDQKPRSDGLPRAERRRLVYGGGDRQTHHMPGLVEPWPKKHTSDSKPDRKITFASK